MSTYKNRECLKCKSNIFTASKATHCLKCVAEITKIEKIIKEKEFIISKNYTIISGPVENSHRQRSYELLTPCEHKWNVTFGNFRKQHKNAEFKKLNNPCPVCGAKLRINSALNGFISKYGIDYDLDKFKDYSKKVRGMSEVNYRKNKNKINPLNLKRGHADYHLDHILPIIMCFKQGKSVKEAADVSNLQMLYHTENLSKGKNEG